MDLTGHVVIVTGSSSGIGEAVARRLAGVGARIVVNSASSVEAGERLAGELGEACYVQGDISDPDTARALVEAAHDRWGRRTARPREQGRAVRGPDARARPGGAAQRRSKRSSSLTLTQASTKSWTSFSAPSALA